MRTIKFFMGAAAICGAFMMSSCNDAKNPQQELPLLNQADFQTEFCGKQIDLWTLTNENGMTVQVTNFGARLVSIFVPDRDGKMQDAIIGFSNIIGLLGFKPPTKDLNVTAALALMSIVIVQYASIHKKGCKGWVKSFAEPMAVVAPINVLELFIKPLSLCMRLFGNVLAAFTIMKVVEIAMSMILPPIIIPTILSLYFDIFDGLIQAYVFVFLTSLYIKEAIE